MIKTLIMENWGPFRGKHVLRLKPIAYAITCQYEVDPGRSNRGGKSMVFEAVNFIHTGRLNKHRGFDANGWISRGEKTGRVKAVYEDGTTISRKRSKGSSTQIRMSGAGGVATQDAAERAIEKYLGFNETDFSTIGYFEQGQMARIIRSDPRERLKAVRGWLGLEKADQAETVARDIARGHVRELQKLKARREALQGMVSADPIPDEESFVIAHDTAKAKLKKLEVQEQRLVELSEHSRTVHEYKELLEQEGALVHVLEQIPSTLADDYQAAKVRRDELQTARAMAHREVLVKKQVKTGSFDGRCPVADIKCPAQKSINSDREAALVQLRRVTDKEKQVTEDYIKADEVYRDLDARYRKARHDREELAEVRSDLEKGKAEYKRARRAIKEAKESGQLRQEQIYARREKWERALRSAVSSVATVRAQKEGRARIDEELKSLEDRINKLSREAAVAVKTRNVFRAAQRRVAENMLNEIGGRSNRMLAEAGAGLRIDIQWEREGKKFASSCELCGAAFPSSTKVRTCEECGAERGKAISHKLDFVLNERSGGADDMGGVALQLSAGSWLLSSRESPWSTAMIDEPFSQMDRTIRRAAAKQLLGLIGASAFRQVFVVSHSQETVDMYPGNIAIHVARDGSRTITVNH